MSLNENYDSVFRPFEIGKFYTFNEAIEYMKLRDKYPTTKQIRWVNAKTGEPVSIGYSN